MLKNFVGFFPLRRLSVSVMCRKKAAPYIHQFFALFRTYSPPSCLHCQNNIMLSHI